MTIVTGTKIARQKTYHKAQFVHNSLSLDKLTRMPLFYNRIRKGSSSSRYISLAIEPRIVAGHPGDPHKYILTFDPRHFPSCSSPGPRTCPHFRPRCGSESSTSLLSDTLQRVAVRITTISISGAICQDVPLSAVHGECVLRCTSLRFYESRARDYHSTKHSFSKLPLCAILRRTFTSTTIM